MPAPLYDAHNHLQDSRLLPQADQILADCRATGIARMVVNGACEEDWPQVLDLARRHPDIVLPSFGHHPWYIKERTSAWQTKLVEFLDALPSAVGEIGLDRWIENHDLPDQLEVFNWQLQLAAARNLPVSIHCLQAWGPLLDALSANPRPERGFVLHSYGGPREMIPQFAKLGAYFSFPGYFAHERKQKQLETFLHVPIERLLIETDAPDQLPPVELQQFPLVDGATSKPLNHPANLRAIHNFLAAYLKTSADTLAAQLELNFKKLFGND